jgi:hypothetical protein
MPQPYQDRYTTCFHNLADMCFCQAKNGPHIIIEKRSTESREVSHKTNLMGNERPSHARAFISHKVHRSAER